MAHKPSRSKKVVDYLRLLGNPYASLSVIEEAQDDAAVATDFEPLTAPERAYVKQLGNQYAPLSIARESTRDSTYTAAGASKAKFVDECRRIFRQYIPQVENGRLRSHYREFIDRNKDQPAPFRAALLRLLAVYDISAVLPGLRLQFNRERDVLTDEKLKQLELAALAALREKS